MTVDASTSMDFGEPTKLQFAKQLAASLGFIGLCRADRVKIESLGTSSRQPGPVLRGRASLWRMMEYLEGIEPGENVSLAEGVHHVRGFQTDADSFARFRVLRPDEPIPDGVRYGDHAGTFRMVAYHGRTSAKPPA